MCMKERIQIGSTNFKGACCSGRFIFVCSLRAKRLACSDLNYAGFWTKALTRTTAYIPHARDTQGTASKRTQILKEDGLYCYRRPWFRDKLPKQSAFITSRVTGSSKMLRFEHFCADCYM